MFKSDDSIKVAYRIVCLYLICIKAESEVDFFSQEGIIRYKKILFTLMHHLLIDYYCAKMRRFIVSLDFHCNFSHDNVLVPAEVL